MDLEKGLGGGVREVAADLNIIRKAEAVERGRSGDGRFKDYVDRYGGPL